MAGWPSSVRRSGPDYAATGKQQETAGDLEQSVETLQEDANLKDLVESVSCLESHPGRWGQSHDPDIWRGAPTALLPCSAPP